MDDLKTKARYLRKNLTEQERKLWNIIRNKDFYYSEVVMSKEDFEEYKKWINEY